ncbi:MAG: phosphoribosylformylglycinamidine synthase I [Candidatus Thorarchaeota archaeon]|jgi:phosphoribosylformylglycinamidine synthase
MTIAIVKFPGTNSEKDVFRALSMIPGARPYVAPSREGPEALSEADALVIPSGVPIDEYVSLHAEKWIDNLKHGILEIAESGKPILGIGNGVQILTRFRLLPGKLRMNESGRFVCKWVYLRVCKDPTIFTEGLEGLIIRVPIAQSHGRFHFKKKELEKINESGGVVFRYCNQDGEMIPDANPNGSMDNVAGVKNDTGNVLGIVPHPERATRVELTSCDGLILLESFVRSIKARSTS